MNNTPKNTAECKFTKVKEVSAKDHFGRKWQTPLKRYISSEEVFKHSLKDGLSPIDMKLVAIKNHQYQHFKTGDVLDVNVSSGNPAYNGKKTVAGVLKGYTILAFPYVGEATGSFKKVKNATKRTVQEGSYINLLNGGLLMFDTPKKVVGLSQDKEIVYVEGSAEPIATEKTVVVDYNAADESDSAQIDPAAFEEEETTPTEENKETKEEAKVIKLNTKPKPNYKLAIAITLAAILILSNQN